MNDRLAAALFAANEESLTALANKGIYKRAVKDSESAEAEYTETDGAAEVSVGGEKCVIKVPLSESKCSCPSRTVCRHIITAVLLLKKAVPDEEVPADGQTESAELPETPEAAPENPPEAEPESRRLTETELRKIHSSAEMCLGLICGVLSHGMVRVPDTAAEDFELAAVRCHAAKMAGCERLMRGLGGRIADCAARRASFDIDDFTRRLLDAAETIESLSDDELTADDLGSFRGEYKSVDGSLDLIPVGQRTISGGEHEGDIYYFVNTDESAKDRFLTFSDIRPTYYETVRKRRPEATPWGLAMPLRTMMKHRMMLVGAKVCEGRLSSSKETVVAAHSPAVLDSPVIHRLMVTDFREIALRLGRNGTKRETDRLFFIYPKRMVHSGFDKHTQRLVMTFEDERGCTADCVVRYRAESKSFIGQLERICKRIDGTSKRIYSLLVSAYIEEGELRLFPIEIYDFITPLELHGFELPQEYRELEENGLFAEEIGRHIACVTDKLSNIVRTGLQSEHNFAGLIAESRSLGMAGLAGLLEDTSGAAESCRHSLKDNSRAVLTAMRKLNKYICAAEERIGVISALRRLETTRKGEE